jgi:hypothetical protein
MGWVRLNLNPHPFKTKRVRHPTAGVIDRFCSDLRGSWIYWLTPLASMPPSTARMWPLV